MSRVTPQIWKVSELLLAYETREKPLPVTRTPPVFLVCEKLRPPLATLMGAAGFRALLARALALANTEAAWPGVVTVKADGTLGGWDELERRIPPKEFADASGVLVARLIGLLVAFIGQDLTFRMLREIWPEVALDDRNLTTETKK